MRSSDSRKSVLCQPGADSSLRRGRRVARPRVGPAVRPPASRSGDGRRGGRGAEPRGRERGLSFPARGGRRRGARPVASQASVAARPALPPAGLRPRTPPVPAPSFWVFSFRSFFLTLLWELECIYFTKPRMEAWRAGFTVSVLLRASRGFLP